MPEKLSKLERRLGYKFKDLGLLERALTHRSWAHENRATVGDNDRDSQNESLEFVGDSVLGLAIAEELYLKNPTFNEGSLTVMKHRLVSAQTLAKISGDLDIGTFLRVGRGEEKTGGRGKHALLANALEAIIGAIFFDGGYADARDFVKKIFSKELKATSPNLSVDYKTMLQEALQAKKLGTPAYRVTKTEGLPHAREFSVEAVWENGRSEGRGFTIKSAEMMAARIALENLNGTSAEKRLKPSRSRQRTAKQINE